MNRVIVDGVEQHDVTVTVVKGVATVVPNDVRVGKAHPIKATPNEGGGPGEEH